MTSEEYCQIWLPAALKVYHASEDAYKGSSVLEISMQLDKLFGCIEFESFIEAYDRLERPPLPENIKKLLEALAGPHSDVVLKVLELRKVRK